MRYLKFALSGLVILFVLLTLIGLMMPSSVAVGRSVNIHATVDSIRLYTNNPANWRYWINGADTANFQQLTPGLTEKNSKFIIGTYTVTIIENSSKYITTIWTSEHNKEQLSRLQLYYSSSTNITTVNWSFEQQLNWYPWERLSAMLRDKVFGPSMEVSLAKLKQVCDK